MLNGTLKLFQNNSVSHVTVALGGPTFLVVSCGCYCRVWWVRSGQLWRWQWWTRLC